MESIRKKAVKTEHGNVHIRVCGNPKSSAAPLLCLHMAPQSGEDFEEFMKLAGRDRFVIAPDYPGYGDSDPLPADVPVTIESYALAMWQVLDALNISQIEALGYHTGSKVGIEMALQRLISVSKLFCISLSTMSPEAYKNSSVTFEPLTPEGADIWFQKLKGYYDPNLPEDILKQKLAATLKVASRSHLGFVASHSYNASILEKLRRLTVPVTLINPKDDLQDITPRAFNYIQNCTLLEQPNWLPGFLDLQPQSVLDVINS